MIARAAGEDESCSPGTTADGLGTKKLVCTSQVDPDLSVHPLSSLAKYKAEDVHLEMFWPVLLSEPPQELRAQELSKVWL